MPRSNTNTETERVQSAYDTAMKTLYKAGTIITDKNPDRFVVYIKPDRVKEVRQAFKTVEQAAREADLITPKTEQIWMRYRPPSIFEDVIGIMFRETKGYDTQKNQYIKDVRVWVYHANQDTSRARVRDARRAPVVISGNAQPRIYEARPRKRRVSKKNPF